ncbi:MAG: YidH family protein [Methyloceanibacter sp.]|uniref:YidH family protein n=1 Tax=Methyloceanibacter sp. TaxID=1965321 RepID=UPI003D6D37B6
MIRSYTDHAANERTFLAWLRTGIAVIAFGFLIEKFDLFVDTMAAAVSAEGVRPQALEHMTTPFGWGAGHAFIVVGIIFILVATFRFVRTGWMLDDQKIHSPGIVADLSLSVTLALLLIVVSVLLFFHA